MATPQYTAPGDYERFRDDKTQLGNSFGFEPVWMPDWLFDFQQSLVEWALRKGRAAIFADCGLGKTPIQLVWAENVVRHTNERILILTPLAVAAQTITEAAKFGIEARRSSDGTAHPGITVTNYEKLHLFDPADFTGVVCDESGILKNFKGVTRQAVTDFMRKMPYRLLATATAAPNDYIELGTSAEALGELGYMDMLHQFFKNDTNTIATNRFRRGEMQHDALSDDGKWRFKRHAEGVFWRWVTSWARAIRKPSDLGFSDERFILPPLNEQEHLVEVHTAPDGCLFALPAVGLDEQRAERRRSIQERCERVAELVADTGKPALVWCHLNPEGDLLEQMIPGAVQVSGSDSDAAKEEKFEAFTSQALRVLVSKPKIGAWGLNFQHCSHITFFPSHSFEQYYQGTRRCYRFGQQNPVAVDIVTTEGEQGVMANLQRKAAAADRMFSELVACMNDALHIERGQKFTQHEEIPAWLA